MWPQDWNFERRSTFLEIALISEIATWHISLTVNRPFWQSSQMNQKQKSRITRYENMNFSNLGSKKSIEIFIKTVYLQQTTVLAAK